MKDERIETLYWERNETALEETAARYGRYCHGIALNILGGRTGCGGNGQ